MTDEVKKPTQEDVQKYIDGAMKRLSESPESLEPYERRLLTKIRNVSGARQQALKDIQDLSNQIVQAQARLRSVELQAEGFQGSVNAYIDEIVSTKWNLDEPVLLPTPPTNGDRPANRKERRAAKAKGEDTKPAATN